MTTFLLILSAMLGTLTQAICCPTVINADPNGWMQMWSSWATTVLDSEEELHSEHLIEVSNWYYLGANEWDFSRRKDYDFPQEVISFFSHKKELTTAEQWLLDQMIDHVKFLEFNALCDSVKVYATTDEEFFAWQDQQEQARLDAIMDQPVEPTVSEWEHQAWMNLCDEVLDAILMEDDYQYMKEWNEFTKDWSKTDSSDEDTDDYYDPCDDDNYNHVANETVQWS